MDLTDEERKLCQQLRDRIEDLKITIAFRIMDFNMIRYLRARNMDIDKAEEMFRKYIKWRVENDIDNALTWDVAPDLKEHFRYKLTGLSHNGGLVACVNVGDWDPQITNGRYEELMKLAFYQIECITDMNKYFCLKRNSFSKMVAIINLEGLTFSHCTSVEWIRALITVLKAFESYYPETLKVAFLINAPWLFSILWSITKPFISTATHERLRFLGSDKESWRSEISQFVPENQFPVSLGGQLPDDFQLAYENGKVQQQRVGKWKNSYTNGTSDSLPAKPVDSIELD